VDAAIVVRDLVKSYAGVRAVDSVSWEARAGEILALLGPNGAGKTTTVEAIAGFRRPDSGAIRVLDLDPHTQHAALVPHLGVMLQEGGIYQGATPAEMLALVARFYRDPQPPERLLEQVGLRAAARQRIRSLSGGQKQRLNLALALVGRPEVALLDEPTAGLDPDARQATWALLEGLRADGVTILLTTHYLEEAEHLADRVAIMHRGRLVALDTPAALAAEGTQRLRVSAPGHVDAAALAAHLGTVVEPVGRGSWEIHASADAIPAVTAWFGDHAVPLTGVSVARTSLQDVYSRLTRDGGGS
jgi:ABC-2 type transport system ATP-binding protein